MRVIDLFREWDEDGDGTVSKKEFRKAIVHLGLEAPPYPNPNPNPNLGLEAPPYL